MPKSRPAVFIAFIILFLLLLFVLVLRRERLGLLAVWILTMLVASLLAQISPIMIPFSAMTALLLVLVLYRFGLLAMISALFLFHLSVFFPSTTEFTAWYATDFTIAFAISLALAVYSFFISLAGQPLFSGNLLED